jgi:hypothetical protein
LLEASFYAQSKKHSAGAESANRRCHLPTLSPGPYHPGIVCHIALTEVAATIVLIMSIVQEGESDRTEGKTKQGRSAGQIGVQIAKESHTGM